MKTATHVLATDPMFAAHPLKLIVNHPAGNVSNPLSIASADAYVLFTTADGCNLGPWATSGEGRSMQRGGGTPRGRQRAVTEGLVISIPSRE